MTTTTDQPSPFDQQLARIAVGGYLDAQEQRKAMMNRIRDIVRKKNEGIPFDQVEEEKDEQDYAAKYADDELADLIEELLADDILTQHEYDYLQRILNTANSAISMENEYEKVMELTEAEPIYHEWLTDVYGISTTLAAQLIHRFGYCGPARIVNTETGDVLAHEEEDGFGAVIDLKPRATSESDIAVRGFPRPSNLWSYAGLAPGQERRRGEQTGFDPDAKTLVWNVATSMVNQGSNSRYRTNFYDPYKARQEEKMAAVEGIDYEVISIEDEYGGTVPATFAVDEEVRELYDSEQAGEEVILRRGEMLFKGTPANSQGHADLRARRYLGKKFMKHYWHIARTLKGWETSDDWVTTHGGHEKHEDSFEDAEHAWSVVRHGSD